MYCFEMDGCEIAHAPAALFYDLIVVPKEPIQMMPVNETDLLPSTEATPKIPVTEAAPEKSTEEKTDASAHEKTTSNSLQEKFLKAAPFLSLLTLILVLAVAVVMTIIVCICCSKKAPKTTSKKGKLSETDTEASSGATTRDTSKAVVTKGNSKVAVKTSESSKKPKKAPSKPLVENIENEAREPSKMATEKLPTMAPSVTTTELVNKVASKNVFAVKDTLEFPSTEPDLGGEYQVLGRLTRSLSTENTHIK
ncbi:hypothetical protein L596_012458 [Steinernema carpocapsae]|uniref:Uncharacterized protein n=1 Tax=Steinernema carpocapsae TaxID=34508 RepID=A0A4U5NXZ7_STECR|nr:hypothetical protein L596_012458 [Steinernema carpocapsae]